MDKLHAMQVFVCVAEHASFSKAATQLYMSPPAVTRLIATLEQSLKVSLFHRTTRTVRLTESGARYLQDCKRLLSDLNEVEAALSGLYTSPQGQLSVTAPVMFGSLHVAPLLLDFLGRYPEVHGRLLLLDRMVHLIEEGVDIAIRIGHLPDSTLRAVRVGQVRRVLCASPQYLEARGTPKTLEALAQHRLITAGNGWQSPQWRFGHDGAKLLSIKPALICNMVQVALDAAEQGWGITRALSYQLHTQLREGSLQIILSEHEPAPLPVYIVYVDGHGPNAAVRAFIDLAREALGASLEQLAALT